MKVMQCLLTETCLAAPVKVLSVHGVTTQCKNDNNSITFIFNVKVFILSQGVGVGIRVML